MTDEIKQAYARGYAAARRSAKTKRTHSQAVARRDAFWQRCFIAALPACTVAENWTTGDKKPINTLVERVDLARNFADEALRVAERSGRVG